MNSHEHLARLAEHLEDRCETAHVDFKCGFDPTSNQDWCELVKDMVAMGNSGGGLIVIGLSDDGSASGWDGRSLANLDPADVSDKIAKYTGWMNADVRLVEREFEGDAVLCFMIGAANLPIVFTKPGTYQVPPNNQQKTAFSQGTVYFRHGAKSEPGTTEDLRLFLEREVERLRSSWLDGIRKVTEAPAGSRVFVVSPEVNTEPIGEQAVRLTNNPAAPLVRELDPNKTHPYRQKEAAQVATAKLAGLLPVSPHDIFAVRKAHGIEGKPEFFYRPKFSSGQFSEAFVDWFVSECRTDSAFLEKAKQALRKAEGTRSSPAADDERIRWLDTFMRDRGLSNSDVARAVGMSATTISLVLRGVYNGNVPGVLQKIEAFRRSNSAAAPCGAQASQ
jgi:hypothetical protein